MKKIAILALLLLSAFALSVQAQETVKLPKPDLRNNVSFADVVNKAKTGAAISNDPLSLADLSAILWVAGGRRLNNVDAVSSASKAYPSAFDSYLIRLYLLAGKVTGLNPGVYQYLPEGHSLKLLVEGDLRAKSAEGVSYGSAVRYQPATVVLAIDMGKNKKTYSEHPWLQMELGSLAELISLTAASRGHAINIVSEADPKKEKALFKSEDDPLLFLPIGGR
jgi:SagB-type dehydrogenase family enzyme